jgi:hypothetical protein
MNRHSFTSERGGKLPHSTKPRLLLECGGLPPLCIGTDAAFDKTAHL